MADDLGFDPGPRSDGCQPRLLIAAPDLESFPTKQPGQTLLEAWRRLFPAKIEAEISKILGAIPINDRIAWIGIIEFEEIRNVMNDDGFVFDLHDDSEVYLKFAAYYCELAMFAPPLIRHAFPGLAIGCPIRDCIAADVDPEACYQSTRPEGAFDPSARLAPARALASGDSHFDETSEIEPEFAAKSDFVDPIRGSARLRLLRRADNALKQGNAVRAAILRDASARTSDRGSTTIQADLRAAAAALERFAARLQSALFFRKGEIRRWTEALAPLLRRASRGFWTPEARLLYDLQKVCIDHERETYRIDLLAWIFSGGRHPLKKPLPHLREVMMCKHLRNASKRLDQIKLAREDRNKLKTLLQPAVHQAESALRDRFRPVIDATMKAHWVVPRNLPERVAYQKLVEELLDGIVEHGYLSLGDLRDGASRSQLKLPDLASPRDFFQGNPLLQTDKALSKALEGVHRRGEVYLRWLQRFSSLAFATPVGRFLSLYIALPFGGSYVLLEGLQHLVGTVVQYFTHYHLELMNRYSFIIFGTVALGAINFLRFRRDFLGAVRVGLRSVRALCYDWPAWLLKNPWLRNILEGRIARLLWRLLLKPALFTILLPVILLNFHATARFALPGWGAAALAGSLLINTRIGRKFEDALLESVAGIWISLVQDLLPGLFHLTMNSFQHVLERLERVLYAVDEWLRFHDGQSRTSLIAKGVIGLAWFGFAYLARIYVNLLIEPQINPIKHFPVVTVSHKVILPMSAELAKFLSPKLTPIFGEVLGNTLVGVNILLLPGFFGFLVWELKSNWRLYEANRSETLDPVLVGSHGESMARLLRPGFHSGTLPKAYAKLRNSEATSKPGARERTALKPLTTLHHAEESIRRFLNRDFLALIQGCGKTFEPAIHVGSIRLSTNRIQVELIPENEDEESLWSELIEQDGTLKAGIAEKGWLERLPDDERMIVNDALRGLYAMCGVQLSIPCPKVAAPVDEIVVRWRRWVDTWEANQLPRQAGSPASPHFGEGGLLSSKSEPAVGLDHPSTTA